ncbi:MAG: phenylalanine--tRNA ligase subunit alpha [Nitrospinota bacterium]|nr:phenylalanine--tRNA ligase subunit alpha [Nitrospinota bacterium]
MIDKIKQYQKEFEDRIAAIGLGDELRQLRTDFLGKKGRVTQVMKDMRELSSEQKREVGRHINELKNWIENQIREKTEKLAGSSTQGTENVFDPTLPGRTEARGSLHPITQVMEELITIFISLGFEVAEGPEVESDYYNFEALNIPKDHPARDMQDTFYIGGAKVLRTHTSPVQIHVMEKQPPPLRIIAPGKVYRCDSDVSHTPMFHQIEGLMVDEKVTFSDLKGVMNIFVHQIFGEKTQVRFRPSFFPFTSPSAEVDIQCVMCSGKGCRVCSQTGWLEILGAGMVDPAVFGSVNYDPEKWTGFAFGMGIERIAMLKYGINDIRLFFENDLRFLSQF